MNFNKINKTYLIIFFLPLLALLFFYFKNLSEKDKEISSRPVSVNLITSVHPDLSWDFKPMNSEVLVKPGEVATIEYIVENLGDTNSTGIATFAYFPRQFENYITLVFTYVYW